MNPITQPLGQDAFWLNLRHEKSHPASSGTREWDRLTGMDSCWSSPSAAAGCGPTMMPPAVFGMNVAVQEEGSKGQNNPLIVIVLLFFIVLLWSLSLIIIFLVLLLIIL